MKCRPIRWPGEWFREWPRGWPGRALLVALSLGGFGATGALGAAAFGCASPPHQPVHIRRTTPRLTPADLEPDAASAEPRYIGWGEHTVATRLAEIGDRARSRWKPYFDRAGVSYPPASAEIVVLKRERRVEVYAGQSPYALSFVRTIAIEAASGGPGPKLREGDRQVPEGIYEIEKLNPNSAYHVSMRLSYPNAFDQRMGERDRRPRLGGDIMIHGGSKSIGCVAVGDIAAEDLFVLSADAGLEHVSVLIAPRDFRRTGESEPAAGQPSWVHELYVDLSRSLRILPAPVPIAAGRSPEDTLASGTSVH